MSSRNAHDCATLLLRYFRGTWKDQGMHGVPAEIDEAMQVLVQQPGALIATTLPERLIASIEKYVTVPMYDRDARMKGRLTAGAEELIVEEGVRNACDWILRYAPGMFDVIPRVALLNSSRRRMECDLHELFSEALYS